MVLQDVAQRARLVVEARAALQRERLLPQDLDLLRALRVEVDDVLGPWHPEDVVDPEGMVGRVREHRVELDGAVQVLAERLLDRDAAARRQPGRGERGIAGAKLRCGSARYAASGSSPADATACATDAGSATSTRA